jgi:hypothetical protein
MVEQSNNTQLYNKSNSIILNLEKERANYKNLLIQYQEAVLNYVNYLKQDGSENQQFVTIKGKQFLGTGALSQNNSASLQNCIASCSNTSGCSGATYNPTNYKQPMCLLRSGDGNIVNGLSSDYAIVPKGKQLLLIVQGLNQQLNDSNQKIKDLIKKSKPINNSINNAKREENKELVKQFSQLTADRVKIDAMLNEYETLDKTQNEVQVVTNKNYYTFILLCILVLLIIFIFFRIISSSSETTSGTMYQSGGGFFY